MSDEVGAGRHMRRPGAPHLRDAKAHLVRYVGGALDTLWLLDGEERELTSCSGVTSVRRQPDTRLVFDWGRAASLTGYAERFRN